jgi:hypothetical protein
MDDNDFGRKLVEEEHLFQVLAAYETATGVAPALERKPYG